MITTCPPFSNGLCEAEAIEAKCNALRSKTRPYPISERTNKIMEDRMTMIEQGMKTAATLRATSVAYGMRGAG